jgi:Flp pilus assembly protein TadG
MNEREVMPVAMPGASLPSARGRRPNRSRQRFGLRVRSASEGQSLVEFSLVLSPLLLVILGIIQFGFVFNSYVTMTNAAREGARDGTIYVYDRTKSKSQNDTARADAVKSSLLASMNLLGKTAPQFNASGGWSASGDGLTLTNGDLVVTYAVPSGITDSDARVGEQITVTSTYHQDLVIPLIGALLPKDNGGRLPLTSQVTMVIN